MSISSIQSSSAYLSNQINANKSATSTSSSNSTTSSSSTSDTDTIKKHHGGYHKHGGAKPASSGTSQTNGTDTITLSSAALAAAQLQNS
jgi:hypothetical protein